MRASNAAFATISQQGPIEVLLYYLRAVPQLFGEELMTILPFLALIYLFATRLKTGRVTAMVLAWLLTAVLFAAAHLHTYGWNLVQALGGVGVARLVLTLPYIITKSLWVATGTHVLNDWVFFSVGLVGGTGIDTTG